MAQDYLVKLEGAYPHYGLPWATLRASALLWPKDQTETDVKFMDIKMPWSVPERFKCFPLKDKGSNSTLDNKSVKVAIRYRFEIFLFLLVCQSFKLLNMIEILLLLSAFC